MQELRYVLIVLGAVAIAALLLHGLWTSRKEKPAKFAERPISKVGEKKQGGFDKDGIGAVRVTKINKPNKEVPLYRKEPGFDFAGAQHAPAVDPLFASQDSHEHNAAPHDLAFDLYDCPDDSQQPLSAPANPKKAPLDFYQVEAEPEPDLFRMSSVRNSHRIDLYSDAHNEHVDRVADNAQPQLDHSAAFHAEPPRSYDVAPDPAPKPAQDLLVLNVLARNNQEFNGEELINCLEQFEMVFGEMEIFHRHAYPAGNGPVIFSVANMFNPGSFPMPTIHLFSTPGITFFMPLPSHGDAEQNFKLMLQTAQQVADQMGGLVMDETRTMMSPQKLDSYRDRVRVFTTYA